MWFFMPSWDRLPSNRRWVYSLSTGNHAKLHRIAAAFAQTSIANIKESYESTAQSMTGILDTM
ncbi:hypothetical protein ACHAWO_000026 [Cyclotella atomus]|uniref:Uncharacterized protein n=1 Tax=Cyclotella atomus TaxID=382360 RepID=A0ABD3PTI6_9STRA